MALKSVILYIAAIYVLKCVLEVTNKTILDEIKELSVVHDTISNSLHDKIEKYLFHILEQLPNEKIDFSFDESEKLHYYNECDNQLNRLISVGIDYYNSPYIQLTFQTGNDDKEITYKMLESFDLKYQLNLVRIISNHFEIQYNSK